MRDANQGVQMRSDEPRRPAGADRGRARSAPPTRMMIWGIYSLIVGIVAASMILWLERAAADHPLVAVRGLQILCAALSAAAGAYTAQPVSKFVIDKISRALHG